MVNSHTKKTITTATIVWLLLAISLAGAYSFKAYWSEWKAFPNSNGTTTDWQKSSGSDYYLHVDDSSLVASDGTYWYWRAGGEVSYSTVQDSGYADADGDVTNWTASTSSSTTFVDTALANADGDIVTWTASTGSDYTCVDEATPNDATDYVYATTTTVYDYVDLDVDTSYTTLDSVRILVRARYTEATGTGKIQIKWDTSGTDVIFDTMMVTNADGWLSFTSALITGLSKANLIGMEIGVRGLVLPMSGQYQVTWLALQIFASTSTPGVRWACVDEVTPNDWTDYVLTSSDAQTYYCDPAPDTTFTGTLDSVRFLLRARDSGPSSTLKLQMLYDTSGTNVIFDTMTVSNDSTWTTKTSRAITGLTKTTLAGMELGVKTLAAPTSQAQVSWMAVQTFVSDPDTAAGDAAGAVCLANTNHRTGGSNPYYTDSLKFYLAACNSSNAEAAVALRVDTNGTAWDLDTFFVAGLYDTLLVNGNGDTNNCTYTVPETGDHYTMVDERAPSNADHIQFFSQHETEKFTIAWDSLNNPVPDSAKIAFKCYLDTGGVPGVATEYFMLLDTATGPGYTKFDTITPVKQVWTSYTSKAITGLTKARMNGMQIGMNLTDTVPPSTGVKLCWMGLIGYYSGHPWRRYYTSSVSTSGWSSSALTGLQVGVKELSSPGTAESLFVDWVYPHEYQYQYDLFVKVLHDTVDMFIGQISEDENYDDVWDDAYLRIGSVSGYKTRTVLALRAPEDLCDDVGNTIDSAILYVMTDSVSGTPGPVTFHLLSPQGDDGGRYGVNWARRDDDSACHSDWSKWYGAADGDTTGYCTDTVMWTNLGASAAGEDYQDLLDSVTFDSNGTVRINISQWFRGVNRAGDNDARQEMNGLAMVSVQSEDSLGTDWTKIGNVQPFAGSDSTWIEIFTEQIVYAAAGEPPSKGTSDSASVLYDTTTLLLGRVDSNYSSSIYDGVFGRSSAQIGTYWTSASTTAPNRLYNGVVAIRNMKSDTINRLYPPASFVIDSAKLILYPVAYSGVLVDSLVAYPIWKGKVGAAAATQAIYVGGPLSATSTTGLTTYRTNGSYRVYPYTSPAYDTYPGTTFTANLQWCLAHQGVWSYACEANPDISLYSFPVCKPFSIDSTSYTVNVTAWVDSLQHLASTWSNGLVIRGWRSVYPGNNKTIYVTISNSYPKATTNYANLQIWASTIAAAPTPTTNPRNRLMNGKGQGTDRRVFIRPGTVAELVPDTGWLPMPGAIVEIQDVDRSRGVGQ